MKVWNPPESDPGMNIASHLPEKIKNPTKSYLDPYIPDLENTIAQFPVGRFHLQVNKAFEPLNLDVETDLKNDEFLRKLLKDNGIQKEYGYKKIMERKTAVMTEDLCRMVHSYAKKINVKPMGTTL